MSMIGNFFAIDEESAKRLMSAPDSISGFLYSEESPIEDSEYYLDIDKSWHGIHFILTNDVWEGEAPACYVVLGGVPVGDDVGYGPARFLDVDNVKAIDGYLSGVDSTFIQENYNAERLEKKEIYPNGWGEAEDVEYLTGYFEELKKFYSKAANESKVVIQYLN
ncbi:YfbM family protein [Pseudomonadota bacterium]